MTHRAWRGFAKKWHELNALKAKRYIVEDSAGEADAGVKGKRGPFPGDCMTGIMWDCYSEGDFFYGKRYLNGLSHVEYEDNSTFYSAP